MRPIRSRYRANVAQAEAAACDRHDRASALVHHQDYRQANGNKHMNKPCGDRARDDKTHSTNRNERSRLRDRVRVSVFGRAVSGVASRWTSQNLSEHAREALPFSTSVSSCEAAQARRPRFRMRLRCRLRCRNRCANMLRPGPLRSLPKTSARVRRNAAKRVSLGAFDHLAKEDHSITGHLLDLRPAREADPESESFVARQLLN